MATNRILTMTTLRIYKGTTGIFQMLLLLFMFSSCEKKYDLEEAPRLFRPVVKGALETTTGNFIEAAWQEIKDADSYTVEVSRDTFRTIDRSIKVDSAKVLFEDLKWDQLYQIQVRANAADSLKNSKFGYLGAVKTPKFPTIVKAATINDVTEISAIMRWTSSGDAVTEIKVYDKPEGTLLKTVALLPADVQNEFKVIGGLTGGTLYYMELMSGTRLRGYESYTTKAPFAGIVIDLREIENRPSVLQDTLSFAPSGSLIILKKGMTYNLSSIVALSKTLTITSGDDLLVQTPANIFFTSNLNFAAGSVIDSISFVNVSITGSDYGSKYVFNTTNSASVGKLKFDNCKIQYFRGIVRLQTGTTILSTYEINNCLIDSISGYGAITVDNATCKAENIIIRNSTLSRMETIIASTKAPSNSITIQNNTFYRAPRGGSYLVDYNTFAVSAGVNIYNNIFSIGKSNAGNTSVRGVRINGQVNTLNNFATSDYVNASNPIPNLIQYTRPSGELFTDPATNNFKIKDNGFPGRSSAGDPRWRL